MRLCGGVATASGGGTSGVVNLKGRGDSNLSGDIALVPGVVDSKTLSRNEAGCRRLIAISCSASLMKPRSPDCSDSNIASGRAGRLERLLSVQRIAVRVFPCGVGGGVFITTPLAQCTRRPRLRELQRQRRPQRASRVRGGGFYRKVAREVCAVIRLSALTPMPPAPLGLLIIGGACRIQCAGLRNGFRGVYPADDGKGYSACVEKLLRIRRKVTPPVSSPEGQFCRASIRFSGRIVLPRSEYRRARRPPMLQMPFPFSGISLLSLHECG